MAIRHDEIFHRTYFQWLELLYLSLNKYLRDHGLLPSENHTIYSFRHSFEDRLTAVEPPV